MSDAEEQQPFLFDEEEQPKSKAKPKAPTKKKENQKTKVKPTTKEKKKKQIDETPQKKRKKLVKPSIDDDGDFDDAEEEEDNKIEDDNESQKTEELEDDMVVDSEEANRAIDSLVNPPTEEKQVKVPPVLLSPPPGMDFVVTIPHPQAFNNLIYIMAHVIQDCHFTVMSTPTFSGLCVNSYDSRACCMVIARFTCDVKMKTSALHYFCVKMATLKTLLTSVQPRQILEISRAVGEANIRLTAYDSHDMTRYQECELGTLDRDPENDVLDKFDSDYTVEIQLNEFRGLVKMAKDLKADDLTFEILEPKERGDLRCSYLVLTIDGEAKCRNVYTSITEWDTETKTETSSVVIRTAEQTAGDHKRMPHVDLLTKKLEERFSITYLTNFMASMKRDMLTIRLSSKGEPMVLYHPLGGDSHVSFVLAPRAKDEHGNPIHSTDSEESKKATADE